jgi:GDP-L-fucose synthase
MEKGAKIYIAGHRGMVGSSIERLLINEGYNNIIKRSSDSLDLRNQQSVNDFFKIEKPEYVIVAAARVGGIHANNAYRAEFIYDNLMIEANIIHASYLNKVKKLLFLGSSCIYPKMATQPISEDSLLGGYLEYSNRPYAISKIAGIELCNSYRNQHGCNFISAMPTNLYGTNDNYHPVNSHVLPALIRKIYIANEQKLETVEIWGTGTPRREFLHVDDLASACLFLLKNYNEESIVNIGCGIDMTIKELALNIANVIGYNGKLIFNSDKPDGTPRKLLNVDKISKLGWQAKISFETGLNKTINEYALIYKQELCIQK